MSTKTRIWAALTADIVRSRQIPDFPAWRDEKLDSAPTRFLKTPYAVTAWDEFQALLTEVRHAPEVLWSLCLHFHPHHLRIGIGIGEITGDPKKQDPVNMSLGGPAFERAREAIEGLKKGRKFDALTAFRTPDAQWDLALNLVYRLHDTLLQEVTPRQWETIKAQEIPRSSDLAKTARLLHIDVSTASRNLQRGHYWQFEETRETVSKLLEAAFCT
jgi:hypothetical protein